MKSKKSIQAQTDVEPSPAEIRDIPKKTVHKTPRFTRTITKSRFDRTARYAVHGFWSGDNVRVSQSVDICAEPRGWGAPKINWSCGGEDHAAEPDRNHATDCFAAAMKDATRISSKWTKSPPPAP